MIATQFLRYQRSGMTPLGWSPKDFGNGSKLKKIGEFTIILFFGQSRYNIISKNIPLVAQRSKTGEPGKDFGQKETKQGECS